MVGSAACIAASSIACVWRRCAARSRARLELPARGDRRTLGLRLHSSSLPRQMLTRIGPFAASTISNAVAARCGAKTRQPVWQRCDVTNPARVNWISSLLCGTLQRPASQLFENVDITDSDCGPPSPKARFMNPSRSKIARLRPILGLCRCPPNLFRNPGCEGPSRVCIPYLRRSSIPSNKPVRTSPGTPKA